jgi:hypothetical protein
MKKPNKIAICLLGSRERSKEQILELKGIENIYEVEWFFRVDLYEGLHNTYSQAINEAASLTESEFIIYINPKSVIKPDHVNEIIEKLCSGYGLAAVSSFGFWGCTKQLFREIGLLDERFLGGEDEDTDFIFRMKVANIAVYQNNDPEIYKFYYSKLTYLRGISRSVLDTKWPEVSTCKRLILQNPEKRLPKNILQNNKEDIKKSWMSFDKTHVSGGGSLSMIIKSAESIDFVNMDYEESIKICKISTKIEFKNGIIKIIPNNDIPLYLTFYEEDKNGQVLLKTDFLIDKEILNIKSQPNLFQKLKIMHSGKIIYLNELIEDDYSCEIKTNIEIPKVSTPVSTLAVQKSNVTFVLTSCGRNDLLEKTLDSFFKYNTYPIDRYIITEDSADPKVFEECERLNREKYDEKLEFIFNHEKLGQSASIDKAYSMVETEYIFHCEEDWEFYRDGFIEDSIKVLKTQHKVIQAWIRPKSDGILNKIQNNIYSLPLYVCVRIVEPTSFIVKDANIDGSDIVVRDFMGFSWNPGVKRLKDWKELPNGYIEFEREHLIDQYYRSKGFMVVSLSKNDEEGYVKHIGQNRRVENHVH